MEMNMHITCVIFLPKSVYSRDGSNIAHVVSGNSPSVREKLTSKASGIKISRENINF